MEELGLEIGPPANLIAACRSVARQTALTVYCPPVVPEGPVQAPRRRQENAYVFGDESGYGLSLQSASLVDHATSGDRLAAQHWVVAATTPGADGPSTVDQSVAYPGAEFDSRPRPFEVDGVEATLVAGDVAGSGFAGSGHAIAYWQAGDVFSQASVHFAE